MAGYQIHTSRPYSSATRDMPTIISHRRQRKVRAVACVVAARRNQLDGVAAEHGQVAIVLLPLAQVPGVVTVGLRPIAELMPAQRISGRAGFAPAVGDARGAALHPHLAQQTSDPEKHPAVVVPPGCEYRIARDLMSVPLGRPGPLIRPTSMRSRRRRPTTVHRIPVRFSTSSTSIAMAFSSGPLSFRWRDHNRAAQVERQRANRQHHHDKKSRRPPSVSADSLLIESRGVAEGLHVVAVLLVDVAAIFSFGLLQGSRIPVRPVMVDGRLPLADVCH